jgi:hypothetical protein
MKIYIVSEVVKSLKGDNNEVVLFESVSAAYFSKANAIKSAKGLKNGVVDSIVIKDEKEFLKKMQTRSMKDKKEK